MTQKVELEEVCCSVGYQLRLLPAVEDRPLFLPQLLQLLLLR
eukprot:COSAG06_NODE_20365_length_798_cov_1.479256_2_plen_42_part_00